MEESVQIQTAQNVEIDYAIAGIGDRVLALFIDYVILAGYAIGAVFFVSLLRTAGLTSDNGFIALWVVLSLPFLCYDLLCEIFMDGQSFGKKALKIKVVKIDGAQPGIGDYFLRWIFRIIDILVLYGSVAIITILINGKGQRLGDIAAGTTVVKLKAPVRLEDTILTVVEDKYQPVFSWVMQLSDSDIATIKKVLNSKVEDPKIANHVAFKTKTAIESKLGIQSDLMPRTFLKTVLKDYNFYSIDN
ncbi:MAG: RDD family protein [bacterium]